ncbi:MAG: hypothetical protein D9V47_08910 [Clostridia bacterium]|nr:MAG: hypothetical protein D9V47_08910 [Clostridia bacterium]
MELKRLSEIYAITPDPEAGAECDQKYPGYYTHWCRFMVTLPHIPLDCIAIVHGPQGCVGNQKDFLGTYWCQYHGSSFFYAPTTNMDQTDAILGAEDKLRTVIKEVDELYKPRMIFILVTCPAGIIQEPVDDVARDMEDKVQAERIIVIKCEGYTSYAAGLYNIYEGRLLANELLQNPEKKIPRSVNILGISKETHYPSDYLEDSLELERLLNKLGITVNSVLYQTATVDSWTRATEAEFNTMVCPQRAMPLATDMFDRWGIPHGQRFNPLGVTPITNWIMEVAEFFEIEEQAEELVKEEYTRIKEDWEEARRLVDGKIVLIDGGDPMTAVGRGIAWGRMCADLGMRPILFNLPPIEIKAKIHHTIFAIQEGFDPEVVYHDYAYHRRFSPMRVIEELDLNPEDIGLYMGDVYPTAVAKEWQAPVFDPANFPRIVTTSHCNKNRGSTGRRSGFTGAGRTARDIINAVHMAERKSVPTLYGRIGGL